MVVSLPSPQIASLHGPICTSLTSAPPTLGGRTINILSKLPRYFILRRTHAGARSLPKRRNAGSRHCPFLSNNLPPSRTTTQPRDCTRSSSQVAQGPRFDDTVIGKWLAKHKASDVYTYTLSTLAHNVPLFSIVIHRIPVDTCKSHAIPWDRLAPEGNTGPPLPPGFLASLYRIIFSIHAKLPVACNAQILMHTLHHSQLLAVGGNYFSLISPV